MANTSNDLMPSEDETRKIIAQVFQINPAQVPVVLMRIELGKLMLKVMDRLRKDLDESIKHLEDEIDK